MRRRTVFSTILLCGLLTLFFGESALNGIQLWKDCKLPAYNIAYDANEKIIASYPVESCQSFKKTVDEMSEIGGRAGNLRVAVVSSKDKLFEKAKEAAKASR